MIDTTRAQQFRELLGKMKDRNFFAAAEVGEEIAKLCGTNVQETIGWIRRELKRNPSAPNPKREL